jgi:hypothetical protein
MCRIQSETLQVSSSYVDFLIGLAGSLGHDFKVGERSPSKLWLHRTVHISVAMRMAPMDAVKQVKKRDLSQFESIHEKCRHECVSDITVRDIRLGVPCIFDCSCSF